MTGDAAIRVVKGRPTDEELAAVVVVLSALSGRVEEAEPGASRSGWSAYAHAVRAPLTRGPHAWRLSARR